jgi:hypothetical protein
MRPSRSPRTGVPGVTSRFRVQTRPDGYVVRWWMWPRLRHRRSSSISWYPVVVADVGMSTNPPPPMYRARSTLSIVTGGLRSKTTRRNPLLPHKPLQSPVAIRVLPVPVRPIRRWHWCLRPGSPVRIGPQATALAVLLTCGHYLPIARATTLLAQSAGIAVSTGVHRRGP